MSMGSWTVKENGDGTVTIPRDVYEKLRGMAGDYEKKGVGHMTAQEMLDFCRERDVEIHIMDDPCWGRFNVSMKRPDRAVIISRNIEYEAAHAASFGLAIKILLRAMADRLDQLADRAQT